ncbi:MAG: transglycosylase SLT domain-containing protein [Erythrobacter sp.]|uniref:transglycosylase SLT domain-containing protein n=1 Tax=Erythrobacter sp. TaxID=1042 RepID=UPI0026248A53|nr:transglycosylase SLT domain-containing protein [Erythrobacter sp.]MDJ0979166.1 transglycosylase SLT domain-containing protein [Erythrobacter sp.]
MTDRTQPSTGQPPAAQSAPPQRTESTARSPVEAAIANAARSTTIDFDYLLAQARVESGLDPRAQASGSSATGLFQFTEATWLATMRRHGARFGLNDVAQRIDTTRAGQAFVADPGQRAAILELRNDPHIAALMAGGLAQDNRRALTPVLSRAPESNELYLAHFLGAGGAQRFLAAMRTDPSQSAAAMFRGPAAANPDIFFQPDGSERSLAGVMDVLSDKMQRAMERASPEARNPGADPSAFMPRQTPPITGGAPRPRASFDTAAMLPMPQPARAAPKSMSSLLSRSVETSGADRLSTPDGAARVERAFQRLRAMGV